jgi:hypothetical protein
MLASLKTLTYSTECSESRMRISVMAFLFCHWLKFSSSVCVMAIFRNRWLSETFF